mmetsp:Transcript_7772/g.48216  ORF Transcript_7772/g.48216 Transcript_7772/m.48216 type:complete len:88 (-) Transcript_7772:2725-2988(-)
MIEECHKLCSRHCKQARDVPSLVIPGDKQTMLYYLLDQVYNESYKSAEAHSCRFSLNSLSFARPDETDRDWRSASHALEASMSSTFT